MPQILQNTQRTSIRSRGSSNWTSTNLSKEENVLKILRDPEPTCRVLIVDRDSMSSDLLAKALVQDGGYGASAAESSHLLQRLSSSEVDLVVIAADLDLRSEMGFELANAVSCAFPKTSVVMLLNQTTHELVVNAFRSGARGVFSRQQPMSEFLDCVEHVRKGIIWAGKQETNVLLEAFKSIPAPNLVTAVGSPQLTTRELQVVRCAAKGKTNKTIANELGLSEHTIKNYLFRAFDKLGISSRVELLFYLTIRGHTFGSTKAGDEDDGLSPPTTKPNGSSGS